MLPFPDFLLRPLAAVMSQPYFMVLPGLVILLLLFFVSLSNPIALAFLIGYSFWGIYLDEAPRTGNRAWLQPGIRTWRLAEAIVERLGVGMERDEEAWKEFESKEKDKNGDTEPKKFIFCTHPHGSFGLGTFLTFMLSKDFPRLFPNLGSIEKGYFRLRGTTITAQFVFPFVREIILGGGVVLASWNAMESWLTSGEKLGEDRAMYLVPGLSIPALREGGDGAFVPDSIPVCHESTNFIFRRRRRAVVRWNQQAGPSQTFWNDKNGHENWVGLRLASVKLDGNALTDKIFLYARKYCFTRSRDLRNAYQRAMLVPTWIFGESELFPALPEVLPGSLGDQLFELSKVRGGDLSHLLAELSQEKPVNALRFFFPSF